MSESHWLERELIHGLGPVEAPEALWDSIQARPAARRSRPLEWACWPVAAVLALGVVGATIWQVMRVQNPGVNLNSLAAEELRELGSDPQKLDFRSNDPLAIRSWVKAKTDLSLDVPAHNGSIRMLGARVIERNGTPIAAIAYRVANGQAALLVSRTAPRAGGNPAARHLFTTVGSSRGGISSWNMRGQVYALACSSKDPQAACLLCHANGDSID